LNPRPLRPELPAARPIWVNPDIGKLMLGDVSRWWKAPLLYLRAVRRRSGG
jgi:hypothetical protein